MRCGHWLSCLRQGVRFLDFACTARFLGPGGELGIWLVVVAAWTGSAAERSAGSIDGVGWPPAWVSAWSEPGSQFRPLQIVHGLAPETATVSAMQQLKGLGLGGIVCNVTFSDYLVSETNWRTLTAGVEACRAAGLRVWIYDERGYPSGSAGGLVLKGHPELQAMELSYDASRPDPFVLRPAYEHTHASNNYHAARKAINLLEPDATKEFLAKTHEAYYRHLKNHFGGTIEAVFTDEPSLMAVNIGGLGEAVRKTVAVDDPLDPAVKALPAVPWSRDLPRLYQRRYGEDLLACRLSLFQGDTEPDRQTRRRFWTLIAELVADRYFGQIQSWSVRHRLVSSGHTLHEESPLAQVPLEGNALKVLRRMDIPGCDLLSSTPHNVRYGWLAAALPSSAALAEGRRRVMSETSDFAEAIAGRAPVTVGQMQATAAWQAAFGVTEFALYYDRASRTAQDYHAYTDLVGRLNAVLREAQFAPDVLLYYPIYDLWAEYRPVGEPLKLESQPHMVQTVVNSFNRLGAHLTTSQLPFALADHELLARAKVRRGGLWLGGHRFSAVILPEAVSLPEAAAQVVRRFADQGGEVIRDEIQRAPAFPRSGRHSGVGFRRFEPASSWLVLGRFMRVGREILLVVNTGAEAYAGNLSVNPADGWTVANPADGRIEAARVREGRLSLVLPTCASRLLVGPRK